MNDILARTEILVCTMEPICLLATTQGERSVFSLGRYADSSSGVQEKVLPAWFEYLGSGEFPGSIEVGNSTGPGAGAWTDACCGRNCPSW